MAEHLSLYLQCEKHTEKLANALHRILCQGLSTFTITFEGNLGVGKTAFCRYLIQAFGFDGRVKSPTYTLVEHYTFASVNIFHFDLYRLEDPEELEFIGIREYFAGDSGKLVLGLIEWPEKGEGFLPKPDLKIELGLKDEIRTCDLNAGTKRGRLVLKQLAEDSAIETLVCG